MNSEALLPCPFCGAGNPSLQVNSHAGMSWVACSQCGIEAPSETGVSADDAVNYWNRRAPLAALPTGDMPTVAWEVLCQGGHLISNIEAVAHQYRDDGNTVEELVRRSEAAAHIQAVEAERDKLRYDNSDLLADADASAFVIRTMSDRATTAEADLAKVTAERDELQRSFDMKWEADQRAIKRWQEAHPGNDLVWPDSADLTVWALTRATTAEARLKVLEALIDEGGSLRLMRAARRALNPEGDGA
jgi:Lar family restriction alleviation protein